MERCIKPVDYQLTVRVHRYLQVVLNLNPWSIRIQGFHLVIGDKLFHPVLVQFSIKLKGAITLPELFIASVQACPKTCDLPVINQVNCARLCFELMVGDSDDARFKGSFVQARYVRFES